MVCTQNAGLKCKRQAASTKDRPGYRNYLGINGLYANATFVPLAATNDSQHTEIILEGTMVCNKCYCTQVSLQHRQKRESHTENYSGINGLYANAAVRKRHSIDSSKIADTEIPGINGLYANAAARVTASTKEIARYRN
ncbi:hypothetical protein AVEN_120510-1 [Araneus ventricosus]|uniref:Uncharacterized protein n=1 Tax=Araneus ventricosus TaxID=182803 RepID=A0A4Y2MNV4_ARAVE|nr:hypothetical protein AVEN_120510-1 [Araneus ventricosus]